MNDRIQVLLELEKRGKLPEKFVPALTELRKRGVIEQADPQENQYAQPGSYDDGYFAQGASGMNEGLANTLGAPVDAMNWAVGKGMDGINAVAGTDLQPSERPFLGSEQFKDWMRDTGSIGPESRDGSKQFVRRIGQEVGAVAVPAAGTVAAGGRMLAKGTQQAGALSQAARSAAQNPGKFLAAETGLATTSGMGAAAAQQMAPDSVLAELLGQFIGGMSPLAVSSAMKPMMARRAVARQTPSFDELRDAKNAAYARVDDLGVQYKPEAVDDMLTGISDELRAARMHPLRHPKASSMRDDLETLRSTSPSLSELDQMRQVVRRDVANVADEGESFFGRKMIDNIDEFVQAAGPDQVVVGDPQAAADAIRSARSLNTQYRKAEMVGDAVDHAVHRAGSTGSGGNTNNAIRQNIRSILDNRKKSRGFTSGEKALMEQIVMGTKKQNALRQVGKLSPVGNGLMTALGIGGAAANPMLAAFPVAGTIAKGMADKGTLKKVDELSNLIRSGGVKPSTSRALSKVEKSALQSLLLGQIAGNNPMTVAP